MIENLIILVAVMGGGRVEVVSSKGCSGLFSPSSHLLRGLHVQPLEPMTPVSSFHGSESVEGRSSAPFSGLIICVTGLSKGMLAFINIPAYVLLTAVHMMVSQWCLACNCFLVLGQWFL